ncbi:unnamed protein product [Closterium sp. Yama58-4]|nr:unnamed protein product [Closterium sp. Yama58-4]
MGTQTVRMGSPTANYPAVPTKSDVPIRRVKSFTRDTPPTSSRMRLGCGLMACVLLIPLFLWATFSNSPSAIQDVATTVVTYSTGSEDGGPTARIAAERVQPRAGVLQIEEVVSLSEPRGGFPKQADVSEAAKAAVKQETDDTDEIASDEGSSAMSDVEEASSPTRHEDGKDDGRKVVVEEESESSSLSLPQRGSPGEANGVTKQKRQDTAEPNEGERHTVATGRATTALKGSGVAVAAVADQVPEAKRESYMIMMTDLVTQVAAVLPEAARRGNAQLVKHVRAALERAEPLVEAWKGARVWGGEEKAIGVIKLLESLRARAQEWRSTLTLIERLRGDVDKMKSKLKAVSKERNKLDLAAAKALPKALHCLNLRLAVAYGSNEHIKEVTRARESQQARRFEDPSLYHYALFSDNVLAVSVVVNSTLQNAKNPEKHVFHVVTDEMNLPAMRAWFALHPPGKMALEIKAVEHYSFLNASYCPVLQQLQATSLKAFYFSQQAAEDKKRVTGEASAEATAGPTQLKFKNPKYLSMLNHLRFYLPEMYPTLNRVVFLDDDIVVQRDLVPLFTLPLHGNVNGAVFTCVGDFHRLFKYLNFSHPYIKAHFDPNACGWAYGMNVFDLHAWRLHNLTAVYHKFQTMNADRSLWQLGTLPPGLMTFYNRTQVLDAHWHVLGLGYNKDVPLEDVEKAAVVHYNGNWKPWLDTAMKHFRPYWLAYVTANDGIIHRCNVDLKS